MKKEYDLDKMKWEKNPYAKKLKQQITIRLDQHIISYFKEMAEEMEVPYQALINLYLKDCAYSGKRPITRWRKAS